MATKTKKVQTVKPAKPALPKFSPKGEGEAYRNWWGKWDNATWREKTEMLYAPGHVRRGGNVGTE